MTSRGNSDESQIGRICLPEHFDLGCCAALRVTFVRMLRVESLRDVRVDLSRVGYMDQFGIGTLLAWNRACTLGGKMMLLERCGDRLARKLRTAGVHQAFRFATVHSVPASR
ncbi:MAG TPA: STAS domain-containing protein [Rhodocyclaceae bacterium]